LPTGKGLASLRSSTLRSLAAAIRPQRTRDVRAELREPAFVVRHLLVFQLSNQSVNQRVDAVCQHQQR
jgi:hypothetical protein